MNRVDCDEVDILDETERGLGTNTLANDGEMTNEPKAKNQKRSDTDVCKLYEKIKNATGLMLKLPVEVKAYRCMVEPPIRDQIMNYYARSRSFGRLPEESDGIKYGQDDFEKALEVALEKETNLDKHRVLKSQPSRLIQFNFFLIQVK